MQQSWSQTRAALAGVVDVLSSDKGWEGLKVRFLNHKETRPCIKVCKSWVVFPDMLSWRHRYQTRDEFECVFNAVRTWQGELRAQPIPLSLALALTMISYQAQS